MAATQPTLAPIDAFLDVYSTVDDLAAIRPDATGPHPRTIRGLLGGACTGWRVRTTPCRLQVRSVLVRPSGTARYGAAA